MAEVMWQDWDNIARIKQSKSLEEALKIVLEDGKYDIEDLKLVYDKYVSQAKNIFQTYIESNCWVYSQSKQELSSLCNDVELKLLSRELPEILLDNIESLKKYPEIWKILLDSPEVHYDSVFQNYQYFKDEPWAKDLFLKVISNDVYSRASYFDFFKKDYPYLQEVLTIALDKTSYLVYENFAIFENEPWAKDIILKTVLSSPYDIIDHIKLFKTKSYFKDIMVLLAKNHPRVIMGRTNWFKNMPWAKEVIKEASIADPFWVLQYEQRYTEWWLADITQVLKNKNVLLNAVEKTPFWAFEYFEIYKTESWAMDIIKYASDIIKNMPNKYYLRIAYTINDLHNEKDEVRFAIIEWYSPNELYKLITKWREEVFTSTYNWIITRFFTQLNNSWKDLYEIAQENNFENIAVFLEAAASYWRIEELLNTIKSNERKQELINHMFENIWNDLVRNSVAIMEIINSLKDKEIIDFILTKLEVEHNKWWENKNAIWIIAKFISKKHHTPFLENLPKEYELPEIKWISNKELFDDKWRNIQQYYFYNDEDGKNSFKSFIDKYKSDTKWKIEEKENYVKITSINSKWRQIIIYANKPEFDWSDNKKWSWIESISSEMKRNNQVPTLVAHRWHSYHSIKTIEKLTPENKLVFLWSCWWFQNIWATLENSPKSQIISTKWTWTMLVNDPLFKHINDDILEWRDIKWGKIWSDISKQVWKNPNFEKYVRPDQNLWALFFDKYKSLSK